MISDAYVMVTCDNCSESQEVELTALGSRGSWDERGVKRHLERDGWQVDPDLCELCVETLAEEAAEAEDEEELEVC